MVGTGAAAVADAVSLTRHAGALGFAGALVLPPFYYKGVEDDGIVRYIDEIVRATAESAIDLYLYNFPAMTALNYKIGRAHVSTPVTNAQLVCRLLLVKK